MAKLPKLKSGDGSFKQLMAESTDRDSLNLAQSIGVFAKLIHDNKDEFTGNIKSNALGFLKDKFLGLSKDDKEGLESGDLRKSTFIEKILTGERFVANDKHEPKRIAPLDEVKIVEPIVENSREDTVSVIRESMSSTDKIVDALRDVLKVEILKLPSEKEEEIHRVPISNETRIGFDQADFMEQMQEAIGDGMMMEINKLDENVKLQVGEIIDVLNQKGLFEDFMNQSKHYEIKDNEVVVYMDRIADAVQRLIKENNIVVEKFEEIIDPIVEKIELTEAKNIDKIVDPIKDVSESIDEQSLQMATKQSKDDREAIETRREKPKTSVPIVKQTEKKENGSFDFLTALFARDAVKAFFMKGTVLLGIVGAVVGAVTDGIIGYVKSEAWGVSKLSGVIGSVVAGSDKGILNAFLNAGKWAGLGAAIGSVVPGIGTLVGGLIGAVFGAVIGYFGGEDLAQRIQKTTDKLEFFWDKLKLIIDVVGGGISFFVEITTKYLSDILMWFKIIKEPLESGGKQGQIISEAIKDTIYKFLVPLDTILGAFETVWKAGVFVKEQVDKFSVLVNQKVEDIKKIFSLEFWKDKMETIGQSLKNFVSNLFSVISNFVKESILGILPDSVRKLLPTEKKETEIVPDMQNNPYLKKYMEREELRKKNDEAVIRSSNPSSNNNLAVSNNTVRNVTNNTFTSGVAIHNPDPTIIYGEKNLLGAFR